MSFERDDIHKLNKINIFHLYPNKKNTVNISVFIKLLLLITTFNQILPTNEISIIKLTIKGPGLKNIFGQEHFLLKYYPNNISINGINQDSIHRSYVFNKSLNNVELKWYNPVIICSGMFYGSSDIIDIDFSKFDTSRVQYMGYMFCNCTSLTSLNLSNFDTSNVVSFRGMFSGCVLLTSLDLSNFITPKLNLIHEMFDGCINLKYINIKNFQDRYLSNNFDDYKNIFNNIPEDVVICVNESNIQNKIFNQMKNIKCFNIDCSENWESKQKKIINKTNDCECELNNCLSCSNLESDINKKICTKCPQNFYLLDNDTQNYNEYKNCYTNMTGYYLANDSFYKKCYYTCEECETEGNNIFHNCLSCDKNYSYEIILNNNYKNCYDNESYDERNIYNAVKNGIIASFKNEGNGNDILLNTTENYVIQVTSLKNELDILKGNRNNSNKFSVIDLKECSDILKDVYNLSSNSDLIVLKHENYVSNVNEKNVQYEVYEPYSFNKLNLSYCSNVSIDIYIPAEIKEETKKLYEDLKDKGYNLFDKNDKFYTDICTPYQTENGTDVLLSDRYNDIYKANELGCQENCHYSDFSIDSQYLKCQCTVVEQESMDFKENEKFKAKTIITSFVNTLKYSNYKVLKCRKLVCQKSVFYDNYGSILTLVYMLGFFVSLILSCITKMNYIMEEIQKALKNDVKYNDNNNIYKDILSNIKDINGKSRGNEKNKEIKIFKFKKNTSKRKNKNNKKENFPPKKEKIKIKNNKKIKLNTNMKLFGKKIKDIKNEKINEYIPNSKINLNSHQIMNLINNKDIFKRKNKNNKIKEIKNKKISNDNYTDYELNSLEYIKALKYDNRTFFKIYWSLLKREHLIIFTFLALNDYNLFGIKLAKFFHTICIDLVLNAFFFSDETMHNLYKSGGAYNFFEQFYQMFISTTVSQLLQIFLNYLTMTDIYYYRIKNLDKNRSNKIKVLSIINCIKIKIIVFYIFTFILFLFYWYAVSSFCAVYVNTQKIFITNSIFSFILGLLYPFVIYFIPTGLRILSLTAKNKKNLKFLYFLSNIIPFF